VLSPRGPTAADPLDFAESQKSLQLPRAQRQRASHQSLDTCQSPIFARWEGGSRKWSTALHNHGRTFECREAVVFVFNFAILGESEPGREARCAPLIPQRGERPGRR